MNARASFRARLRAREPILGTFVKTPSAIVCEVLAMTPLDCVCLDAEHAPFDRERPVIGERAERLSRGNLLAKFDFEILKLITKRKPLWFASDGRC